MSVPTKERIDFVIRAARANTRFSQDTGKVIVALADENDRLEALFQQVHGVHSSWVAQAEKHRLENDRLRAERDDVRVLAGNVMRTLGSDEFGPAMAELLQWVNDQESKLRTP